MQMAASTTPGSSTKGIEQYQSSFPPIEQPER